MSKFNKNNDWESVIAALRRIENLNNQEIDPKEIMSPIFNKVFDTEEEAIRDAKVRDYKKGKQVESTEKEQDQLIEDLADDLIDRLLP